MRGDFPVGPAPIRGMRSLVMGRDGTAMNSLIVGMRYWGLGLFAGVAAVLLAVASPASYLPSLRLTGKLKSMPHNREHWSWWGMR
jgi:hypothetical protein